MNADRLDDGDVEYSTLDAGSGLDPFRLSLFRRYLSGQYSGPSLHGQGSAEIFWTVRDLLPPDRRIDVGCGVSTLFWIIAAEGAPGALIR